MIDAIKQYGRDVKDQSQLIGCEIERLSEQINNLKREKEKLNRRLDFFLQDDNFEDLTLFKEEYKSEIKKLNEEIEVYRERKEFIKEKRTDMECEKFSWKDFHKHTGKIQDIIQESDPMALKNVYKELFKSVVIGNVDNEGNRPLHFILNKDLEYKSNKHENKAYQCDPASECEKSRDEFKESTKSGRYEDRSSVQVGKVEHSGTGAHFSSPLCIGNQEKYA